MTARAQGSPLFKGWDRVGRPLAGGRVHTLETGTSTPKATFADPAGAAAHTNPVVLDSAGEAAIFWGTGLYKVRVEDALGVLQWEVDGYDPQVADVPAPAVNLVANGSFEADTDGDGVPDGWQLTTYAGGTADLDRFNADTNPGADPAHGQAALRFVSPGGAGQGGGHAESADCFEVAEGEDLDVAFRVKATAAGVHNKVDVLWFDAAGAALGIPQTTAWEDAATNPTVWQERRARLTPPAGARLAKVRLYGCVDDNATAGTTRFDHVTVRAVEPQYLRSGEADQVDGVLTFTANPNLANNIQLQAKATDGNAYQLLRMTPANTIQAGHGSFPLEAIGTALTFNGNTVWHAGNDGAGGGLDADRLDGLDSGQFLRADAADQVSGVLTFLAGPVLTNNLAILGNEAGGTARTLLALDNADQVGVGSSANPLRLVHNGTLIDNSGNVIWHAGNDGAGSGLDADSVDGLQGAELALAGHSHVAAEASAFNPSDVAIPSSGVTVVTLDLGTVQAGQRILVTARQTMMKGAVAGVGTMAVDQDAGTASILDLTGATFSSAYRYMMAGVAHRFYMTAVFKVVTGGTLTLRMQSASGGSDGTVPGLEGLLGALVLNL